MKRILYLLVFVLVVGAIVWLVPTDAPVPSEPIDVPAVQTSAPVPEEPSEPAVTESTEARPVEEEAAGVRGQVLLLETGDGVDGATVRVSWVEDEERRVVEEVTDAEGRFSVASRGEGDYRIEVSHATLASEERRYRATISTEEPAPEVLIWMVAGGAISGRVYDSMTDEGIAGVRVGLNRRQTPGATTDADGRYRLGGILSGNRQLFLGHAKGYIDPPRNSNGIRVSVSAGEELSDVDFSLQPGVFAAIAGKVVDAVGAPVAGAEVSAGSSGNSRGGDDRQWRTEKTKRDGTFYLDEFRVADGFYVTAKSEGHVSEELGLLGLTVDGIRDLVLTLRPTGSISGQVVDENSGTPVGEPEFVVDVLHTIIGRNRAGGRPDNLDENGNFKIDNLPPGPYGLFIDSNPNVWRSGIVRAQVEVNLEHGQHLTGVRLTYDYAGYLESKAAREARSAEPVRREEPPKPKVGEVRGRVVRAGTGEAVTTFQLTTAHRYTRSSQNVHDPEGRFTIKEREGETLTIGITSEGYVPKQEEVQGGLGEQPVHDITVSLQPGAVVEGELVDASGKAVAGGEIFIGVDPSIMSDDPYGHSPDAVSGPAGSFLLDTLSATATRIYARHPAFAVGSAEVRATTAYPTQLRIVLSDGGTIEGFVRRSGGPLSGQSIMVLNEGGTNIELTDNRADNEGRYRLDHLAPGIYTLYTYVDEYSRSMHREAEVAEGLVTAVDFDFDETDNAIEGTVSLNGEQPSTLSVRAEIQTERGVEKFRLRLPGSGEYSLVNLPLGEANVTVRAYQDGTNVSETFTVSITGGVIQRDFDLQSEE